MCQSQAGILDVLNQFLQGRHRQPERCICLDGETPLVANQLSNFRRCRTAILQRLCRILAEGMEYQSLGIDAARPQIAAALAQAGLIKATPKPADPDKPG